MSCFCLSRRGDGVGGPRSLPRTVNGTVHRAGVSGRARDPRRLGETGETQFEERATAATTARRRNFVDPCHSSWSRCVEVRELSGLAAPPQTIKVLVPSRAAESSIRASCVRKAKVPTPRHYSPGFPVKPCNFYGIAVRAVRALQANARPGARRTQLGTRYQSDAH